MTDPAILERYRCLLRRLLAGPSPRGAEFDLYRAVVTRMPGSTEAAMAARRLLEGAMADALTPSADAQDVMSLLRDLDHHRVDAADLTTEA